MCLVLRRLLLYRCIYQFHMYEGTMNESTKETHFNNAITVRVSSMFETYLRFHTNVTKWDKSLAPSEWQKETETKRKKMALIWQKYPRANRRNLKLKRASTPRTCCVCACSPHIRWSLLFFIHFFSRVQLYLILFMHRSVCVYFSVCQSIERNEKRVNDKICLADWTELEKIEEGPWAYALQFSMCISPAHTHCTFASCV